MNTKIILRVIAMITLLTTISTTAILQQQQQVAHAQPSQKKVMSSALKAPIATSGDNIYIVWWTNKSGNDEVMFRASTDGGKTFGDKINLSNSPKAESQDAEIDTFGDNDNKIIVTWWERNQTSNEPVARISTDKGQTFEPALKLSTNGTISSTGGG